MVIFSYWMVFFNFIYFLKYGKLRLLIAFVL